MASYLLLLVASSSLHISAQAHNPCETCAYVSSGNAAACAEEADGICSVGGQQCYVSAPGCACDGVGTSGGGPNFAFASLASACTPYGDGTCQVTAGFQCFRGVDVCSASGTSCYVPPMPTPAPTCTSGYDWWCEECSSGDCAANGCKTYGKSCPSLPTTNLGGWIPDNSSAERGCCVACAEPLWKIDSPESVVGDNVVPGVWSDILVKGEQAEYNTIGPNFEMEFQITFNSLPSGWNSYIRLIAKKNGAFVDTTGYPGRLVSGWQKSGNQMTLCFSTGANLAKCATVENVQVGTPVRVKLVLANSTSHTAKYYADDVLLRTEQLEDNHPTSPDYVGQYPISQTYLRLADSYHGVADATVNSFLAVNKPGAEDSYPLCSAPVRATCGDADGAGTAKVAVTCPSGYGTKANTTNTHCAGKACDTSAASSTDTATCCEVITTTITTTSGTTASTTITTTTLTTTTLTATASSTTATATITTATLTTTTLTATASSTTATRTITSSTVSSTTLTTASVSSTSTATTTVTTASVSRTTVTATTASATTTSTTLEEESELSLSTTQSAQAVILFFVVIWQTAGSLQGRGC